MSFRNKPGVDQLDIPTVPTVGELIVLVDVGGSPGMPAIDGSNLTNVTAAPDVDKILIDERYGTALVSRNTGNILITRN